MDKLCILILFGLSYVTTKSRYGPNGKLDGHVAVPTKLRLPYPDGLVHYALTGIVVHLGHSTKGGHYIAYVTDETEQWWQADDKHVCNMKTTGKVDIGGLDKSKYSS